MSANLSPMIDAMLEMRERLVLMCESFGGPYVIEACTVVFRGTIPECRRYIEERCLRAGLDKLQHSAAMIDAAAGYMQHTGADIYAAAAIGAAIDALLSETQA